jgi:hypothetical protein
MGMGENDDIAKIFVRHTRDAFKNFSVGGN